MLDFLLWFSCRSHLPIPWIKPDFFAGSEHLWSFLPWRIFMNFSPPTGQTLKKKTKKNRNLGSNSLIPSMGRTAYLPTCGITWINYIPKLFGIKYIPYIGSMGLVYFATFGWFFMVNVGPVNMPFRPMAPMGLTKLSKHFRGLKQIVNRCKPCINSCFWFP